MEKKSFSNLYQKLPKGENIGRLKSSILTAEIFGKVASVSKGVNFIDSREKARERTLEIYNDLFSKVGIEVSVELGETFIEYVDISLAIRKYIDEGINSPFIPKLFLSNHQAYGLEALGAYFLIPERARIVLKDDLLKPPFFGKGIKSLNPIIFDRKMSKKESIKYINSEQEKHIKKGGEILVFPEGTRSKNGDFNGFNPLLYRGSFDSLKENDKAVIITSHTYHVFPNTFEKIMFGFDSLKKGKVEFIIDILEIGNDIKDFNKRANQIIEYNLQKNF